MIVRSMSDVKEGKGLAYRRQCAAAGMPYSSLMRWRARTARGLPPIALPGPRKKSAIDAVALDGALGRLRHGRRRSAGAGELYQSFRGQLSRRRLSRLVRGARAEKHRVEASGLTRVRWQTPGLVWALDDCAYMSPSAGAKLHLHNVQDVCSRYKFAPIVGLKMAGGEAVAANLEKLFEQYGPPLFLKRDNGGNLNHAAVGSVLRRHRVIPLNSPPYYPRYNGGMERAQREIKEGLAALPSTAMRLPALAAEGLVNDLNHKSRRCLGGESPCHCFGRRRALMEGFTSRKRKEVYTIIEESAKKIVRGTKGRCDGPSSWRIAIESWLIAHSHITITNKGKVLPGFFYENCS